jgi:hypothetical protein
MTPGSFRAHGTFYLVSSCFAIVDVSHGTMFLTTESTERYGMKHVSFREFCGNSSRHGGYGL